MRGAFSWLVLAAALAGCASPGCFLQDCSYFPAAVVASASYAGAWDAETARAALRSVGLVIQPSAGPVVGSANDERAYLAEAENGSISFTVEFSVESRGPMTREKASAVLAEKRASSEERAASIAEGIAASAGWTRGSALSWDARMAVT